MQFISNGPDIPNDLLQAHEEGRVIFFCGAGISYPAGLPGFKDLVKKIYELNGTSTPDSHLENQAFESGQYDVTLDLLERRLPGQRLAVRKALALALKPKTKLPGAIDTQEALLHLGRSSDGALRLVTTNFDRTFHIAAKRAAQKFEAYAAPMLPIPKNSRWNGLVYLHGLLPQKIDETSLNRLVVTSGDFGLAYLTERWAARFVSELFRNYVVCFVGYSLNDPVMRYMMDALAADRMLGEVTPQAWAFGDCEEGQEEVQSNKWKAKGIEPILYRVTSGGKDHSALHQTLHTWAATYRDGVQGKEAIVTKYSLAHPQNSTQQDDFVGRVIWALSDKSGLPAKCFADLNPTPSIDWFTEALAVDRFAYADLARIGVATHDESQSDFKFSLIRRPAPYRLAPWMQMVNCGISHSQWDGVMFHLGRWLVRHLNDPKLLIWFASQGGQLHHALKSLVEGELDRIKELELANQVSQLDEIRSNAPNAIPSQSMRTLWRLVLSGSIKSPEQNFDLYSWKRRLVREGLTTALRLQLREILAPKIKLRKALRLNDQEEVADETLRIDQLVDCEITLSTDYVGSALSDLRDEKWTAALPVLFDDFQRLLLDALDIARELDEANEHADRSHWDLPSIEPHYQNRGYHEWVYLIELLRDAWLSIQFSAQKRAVQLAKNWFDLPYATFKRLAFFAASRETAISSEQWVDWLIVDGSYWLWSTETGREVYRLLVNQGAHLSRDEQERLEATILSGPPRDMFQDGIEEEQFQNISERAIWLHLAKLNSSGLTLGSNALSRLTALSSANPKWQLATNQSDEFSHWMSGTGDPDFEENVERHIVPRVRRELVEWLKTPKTKRGLFYEDDWTEVCKAHSFVCSLALNDLAKSEIWPLEQWRQALQVWSQVGMPVRSFLRIAKLICDMPDSELKELVHAAASWIESLSKSIDTQNPRLLELCFRIMTLDIDPGTSASIIRDGQTVEDPVFSAINHPIGKITHALINYWFKKKLNDNDLLPPSIKPMFTTLCDATIERFKHGRVILGSRLITFFRVDREWTQEYLLPFFDWNSTAEAKGVWEGFLWSPRLYSPLLKVLKSQFLDSASHHQELGKHGAQFAAFLTYAALEPVEGYSEEEFRSALKQLPPDGLVESARTLYHAVASAGDQRESYWNNRAYPFWQNIWPKSRQLASPKIGEFLALMAISTRGRFPNALEAIKDWMGALKHPYTVVSALYKSGLCTQFPEHALSLLNLVCSDQRWGAWAEVRLCLDEISAAEPGLLRNPIFLKLREFCRKYGE